MSDLIKSIDNFIQKEEESWNKFRDAQDAINFKRPQEHPALIYRPYGFPHNKDIKNIGEFVERAKRIIGDKKDKERFENEVVSAIHPSPSELLSYAPNLQNSIDNFIKHYEDPMDEFGLKKIRHLKVNQGQQTPSQRAAKYNLAKEAGATKEQAEAERDHSALKVFNAHKIPVPSLATRQNLGLDR